MDHHSLEQFFMWGTILGVGIVTLSGLGWPLMRNLAHRLHGRLFGVSPSTVDMVCYAYLAAMKLSLAFLFLIPWIALMITRPESG